MFHEADSIVMQSYTKGFGLVALEAIPAGMVVFYFSEEQSECGMSQIHQRNIDKPKVALSYHGNSFRTGTYSFTPRRFTRFALLINTFRLTSQRNLRILNYKAISWVSILTL